MSILDPHEFGETSVCVCVCVCVLQYLPSTAVNTTLQLQKLRERMLSLNIYAYIIPGTDAHLVRLLSVIIN